MSEMKIFDRTIGMLGKVLDLRQRKQELIASNIANAETPGYIPSRLSFEEDLAKALESKQQPQTPMHPRHIPITAAGIDTLTGQTVRRPDQGVSTDGNGVDLDQQLIAQSENQLLYESAAQIITKKLATLKYVCQDGR
ncbi:MAG: flagellar basal body rod protein FlgB [Pedobacter sp.]